jgi:endoglucanase
MRNITHLRRTLLVLTALLAVLPAAPALAGTANAGLPGASGANPLSGLRFGTYHTPSREPSIDAPSAYSNTARSATDRGTFAKILDQPRFRWFTSGVATFHQSNGKFGAREAAARYVQDVTHGNRNVGVQVAIFRLEPFEQGACGRLPTRAQQADYKRWISEFARGLGRARTALILQPDMPFTLCLPHGSNIDLKLIDWTARTFNALEHTTVYIDGSAIDYLSAAKAADMLRRADIRRVRGFALDLTHFSSSSDQVNYGHAIQRELRKRGIRGKHFLVDTAQNGAPFTVFRHRGAFRSGAACTRGGQKYCVTLGRPPQITRSGDVDGYVWSGRPWVNGRPARGYTELLRLIRSSPFF